MNNATQIYTENEFNTFLKIVGLNIAKQRKLKNLTQEELAELAGISRNYLGKIESKKQYPQVSLETLYSISKVLDVDVSIFFEGTR